jgi:hypothetical protein
MATEFDANNPAAGLSKAQIATLLAEQKRLATSTPVPVKRSQQIAALQATQKAAEGSAAARTSRSSVTQFSGKGTDAILASDVYDIKESTTLNSVFESAKGAAKDAVDYMNVSPSDVRNLLNTALDLKSGYITPASALSRLGAGLNPATLLKIKDGAGGLLDKIASGLGINPDIINEVKVGVSGAFSYITGAAVEHLQSSFDVMKGLLGNSELLEFFDIQSETSLLSGMFETAVDYGLMDVLEAVKVSNLYDIRSFEYAVSAASSLAVNNGDVSSIGKMLNHISVDRFLGENPNAVKDLLQNYKLKENITPDQYPGKLNEKLELFAKLDSNWSKVKVNNEYVPNYGILSGVSDDAIKLIKLNPELREMALVAPFYKARSAIDIGREMYPNSAIGEMA